MSAAQLAKLVAKTVNFFGTGGVPELTGTDVARAMARCPCEYSFITLTAKYADDDRSTKQLQAAVGAIALARMLKQNLEHPDGYHLGSRRVGLVVCFQHVCGYKCNHCHGSGELDNKECPICKGSTYGQLSDSKRAELLGVGDKGYAKHWRQLVEELELEVASWEQEGLSHLNRRLR